VKSPERPFDEQPLAELDSEAIDFRAASELFLPVRRLRRRDLKILGLVVEHQGARRPTVGGALLFGKDRRRWFPDAYLQAGYFDGRDRTRILDTVEIHSHLPAVIEVSVGSSSLAHGSSYTDTATPRLTLALVSGRVS
jgi:ATP-dependent DNA helicase RecG